MKRVLLQQHQELCNEFVVLADMKYTLEIPDQETEFVLEFLRRVTSVKITPVRDKVTNQDTTAYLLSDPANARELMESIAQARRGEVSNHVLLPA